jgi:polyhydroxybutyrate depolymerase
MRGAAVTAITVPIVTATALALSLLAGSAASAAPATPGTATLESYGGRDIYVYAPPNLPARGSRALVVVLHGGLGNAERIVQEGAEHGLNMDEVASRDGFVVAYLSGTRVAERLGPKFLGWNAGGGCCGLPAANGVDDVAWIEGAVRHLVEEQGIDPRRIYGTGHSNGAAMTERLMCESGLYAAAVVYSGPLNIDVKTCPAARGKRILAVHGADDANVPVAGGQGSRGVSHVGWKSEDYTRRMFAASGADFRLEIVAGADHNLDHIAAVIERDQGVSLAQKGARFFGLEPEAGH